MARGGDLFQDFGMPTGVLADREEHCLGALFSQRLQHRRRVARPRTVVVSQHDFLVAEEVIRLEVFEAEAGSAGGVNLHHARDAKGVRVFAFCLRGGRRGGLGILSPGTAAYDRH